MANIFNYITKYADKTFEEKEFNEIDAVMMSAIVYVDFYGIVGNDGVEVSLGDAIVKFLKKVDVRKFSKSGFLNKDLLRMVKMIKDKIILDY